MHFRPSGGARAALIAALLAIPVTSVAADDYPHVALYWSIHGDGRPLIDPATGALSAEVADAVARYQQLVVDVDPIAPYRPDLLDSLRQRRPGMRILAYVTGHYIWPSESPDSLHHYPTIYWHTVRDLDGFLYNKQGQQFGLTNFAFSNVNMARRDAAGRYVVAEAVAEVMWSRALTKAPWDGMFLDCLCDGILWAQSPAESIDHERAGYPDLASFDTAWRAGTDTLASRLRALAGPGAVLVGNCGQGTKYPWLNGWMRENFPYQNGGTWDANMFADPGGYMVDEARFLPPTDNFIFTRAWPLDDPYAAENARRVRYGLGSAALGDGYACFGYSGRVTDDYPYWMWWYDEYAVDLATGASSTRVEHTGWLGQPVDPWLQMIWLAGTTDAVTNPTVETDLHGWSLVHEDSLVVTLGRDTSTAGEGHASMRVYIERAGRADSLVCLSNDGTMPILFGGTYSAIFRAKGSAPRSIDIVAGVHGEGEYARATVAIDTIWRQYQATLKPFPTGTAGLQFQLGSSAGELWLDDVHFQPGLKTVYRRDFRYGLVLVNPGPITAWVPLERSYQRIQGIVDPTTNNGDTSFWFTVAPSDALFLIDPLAIVGVPRDAHLGRLELFPPVPNPMRGTVGTVLFVIPRADRVRLELFDVLGRLVVSRAPDPLGAGSHALAWDVGHLPAGLYFVRLVTGAGLVTAKWVILE